MRSLFSKLFLNYIEFFSKDGVLNSDGRRVLEEILRPSVKRYSRLRKIARRVRKDPTLENVMRIGEEFMPYDVMMKMVEAGMKKHYVVSGEG
jgi:hypothetical protein